MLPTYFLLLMLGLLVGLQSASAIKCYVCAPVPEIGQTCSNVMESDLENCELRHDACNVLFVQHTSGHTEITRNCGKFRGAGAFHVGPNECKDIETANHKTSRICNCQSDRCNDNVIPQTMTTPAPANSGAVFVPSVKPATDANNRLPQPTVSDTTPNSASTSCMKVSTSLSVIVLLIMRHIF